MTSEDLCRLCVSRCQDFKRLFDENGHENDAYLLMVKYFDSSYFNAELAKQSSVICFQCWQHIYDFNTFQQSVLKAQQKLLQSDEAATVYIKSEPEPQHEMDMANSPINIKLEKPDVIDETVVADSSGEISLFEINAVCEKSQANFIGKDLNNSPFQQYNNQTPNVHKESEAFAEPKIEIMDVLSSSDDSTQNNDEIFRDSTFSAKSLQLKSNVCSLLDPPLLQRIESNKHISVSKADITVKTNTAREKVAPRRSTQDIDKYISKLLPSVECGICKEKQPTFTHLLQHFHLQHPAKECYTTCCGTIFKMRSVLAHHVKSLHSVPNAYACKLCNKSYLLRRSLTMHMRYHNPDNTSSTMDAAIAQLRPRLECVVCKETSSTYSLLRNHFKREHPLHEFYILCCKRKLRDRHHLQQHLQLHTNPNAFQCGVCNKCCTTRSDLFLHMRVTHPTSDAGIPKLRGPRETSDELDDVISRWKPNLECALCSASCPKFSLLKIHFLREHPQEECHIICCKRKFKIRAHIIEHYRHHANPNIFKCELCHRHCRTQRSLQSHMRCHNTLLSKKFT